VSTVIKSYRLHYEDCDVEIAVDSDGDVTLNFYDPNKSLLGEPVFSFASSEFDDIAPLLAHARGAA
jgi:hypothetical protein